MQKVPENIQIVIKTITPLIVVVVLFFFLGNIGFTKISQIREEISTSRQQQLVLTEKFEILRNVSLTGAADSNTAANALPDTSPALLVVSQLRNQAATHGLVLSSIKAKLNPNPNNDLNAVLISFNVLGGEKEMELFLLDIPTFSPISLIDKIKISRQNGVVTGEIGVSSFWAPLPTKLPATIEGFQDLTADDKSILEIINGLKQPTFASLPSAETTIREDPFVN